MNKIKYILSAFVILLSVVSCDDFLGDNKNPNQAIAATPQLVLPNALTRTADLLRAYNDAGSWIAGYIVNAGGFGGFGSVVTYNFTTNDHAGMWAATYDDLNNYEYILLQTEGVQSMAYFNAVARTMKAFNYQMLVDFFGNVPYSEALKGAANVAPVYDDAATIYKDLVSQLDIAIDVFENATLALPLGVSDVMFKGDIEKWAQFANTLKLKLLIRVYETSELGAFATAALASWDAGLGVITDDAMVNPGYIKTDGKMNPNWAQYHSNAAGAQAGNGRSRIPSKFVWAFYDGAKLFDNYRGPKTYKTTGFDPAPAPQTPPKGHLGDQTSAQPFAPTNYLAWYVGVGKDAGAQNTIGLFKGPTASSPVLLAAEAQFLLAEAQLKAGVAGDPAVSFDAGILASFNYLYKDINGVVASTFNVPADIASYKADNAGGPGERLVNFAAAATEDQKLEAIITQKYIALNFIHGHEAWSEFRRTGYPAIEVGSADPVKSFASMVSTSTRPDKLPVRVLYPASEYQLNEANVPGNISQFSNLIFWQNQ